MKETITHAFWECSARLQPRNDMCRALQAVNSLSRSVEDLMFPVGSLREARMTCNALLQYLTEAGLADILPFPPADPGTDVLAL